MKKYILILMILALSVTGYSLTGLPIIVSQDYDGSIIKAVLIIGRTYDPVTESIVDGLKFSPDMVKLENGAYVIAFDTGDYPEISEHPGTYYAFAWVDNIQHKSPRSNLLTFEIYGIPEAPVLRIQ